MLQSLTIRDVVLIEKLDLDFLPGLCVFTGETGAGKSILLDSLGLAMGERADVGLIRKGAEKSQVVATFSVAPSHPLGALLSEHDIPFDEGVVALKRILNREGPSKCFINDLPVTVTLLRQVAEMLIEIHGQFDQLLESKTHRKALDTFGDFDLDDVARAYGRFKEELKIYEDAQAYLAAAKERESFIKFTLEDLEKLAPKPSEEERLQGEKSRVAHRGKIAQAAGDADQALSEGIMGKLVLAQKSLERVQDFLPEAITPLMETLDRAMIEVEEAGAGLQDLLNSVRGEALSLESVESRLYELRSAARKHNVGADGLYDFMTRLKDELQTLEQGEDHLITLKQAVDLARDSYLKAAQKLSQLRQTAARKLEAAMGVELEPLKLGQAKFIVHAEEMDESHWTQYGIDRIEFHVATNPGTPSGPLAKIASGGEMSRLMLALKVVLAGKSSVPTLIFDEIDTGTGGAVAAAMGERLKRLSKDMQVLTITHSPQVAAKGDQHFHVAKSVTGEVTLTKVFTLDPQERFEEIARMLSGSQVTDEARAQAKKLMAS